MLPSKEIVLILLCPPQISWLSYVNSLPSSLNTKKSLEIKIWIIPVGAMLFSVMRIRNSWGYGVETHLYLSNTDMTTPSPHNQILVSLWLIVRSFWCCEENRVTQNRKSFLPFDAMYKLQNWTRVRKWCSLPTMSTFAAQIQNKTDKQKRVKVNWNMKRYFQNALNLNCIFN